jgi:hypothetical protein
MSILTIRESIVWTERWWNFPRKAPMKIAIKLAGMSTDTFRHSRIKATVAVAMMAADGEACCKIAPTSGLRKNPILLAKR